MSLTARDLVEGKLKPVTILQDQPARLAVELMIENGFSQLPVVDPTNRPLGLVTGDSILLGVANLRMSIDDIPVKQVMNKLSHFYTTEAPVLELLSEFNTHSAALVVDFDGKLIGIITTWDTSNNFKKRAGDIYLLEDIEALLRDHINAAFGDRFGKDFPEKLQFAIDEITNTSEQRAKDIKQALGKYNKLASISQPIIENLFEEAFKGLFGQSSAKKRLADLTFYEYSILLLHKQTWPSYSKYLTIPTDSLRQLLDEVRESRNAVAHFKREITEVERRRIKYCKDVLQEFYPPLQTNKEIPLSPTDDEEILTFDENLVFSDSMYAPLAKYLREQPKDIERLITSFKEVEGILKTSLPESARSHRSWWANDSVGHVQSQQWLSVGWRVASVNMTEGTVIFSRNREREQTYINFFSALLTDLRKRAEFEVYDRSPGGDPWISVKAMPHEGPKAAWLNESFTLGKRFRVELYIDTHSGDKNRDVFERLYAQKNEIEQKFGGELIWEPLDTKRACRVAVYHDGSITDRAEKLATLREWAVDATIRLEKAISHKIEDALRTTP